MRSLASPRFGDNVSRFLQQLKEECFDASVDNAKTAVNVSSLLEEYKFDLEAWKENVVFDDVRYSRVLLAFEPRFSVLLYCFKPGQETPRHTHGEKQPETHIKILEGELTLTTYDGENVERSLKQGETLFSDSSLGEHKSSNQSSNVAITLHVYSPPYISCCFTNTEGKVATVPPVLGPRATTAGMGEMLRRTISDAGTPGFTNLTSIVELLQRTILPLEPGKNHPSDHIDYVRGLLDKVRINPDEWSQYSRFTSTKYTRNIIGHNEKFTILLLCWDKGQMSPIHDHAGSSCWVKALKGNLREVKYRREDDGEMSVIADQTFPDDAVAYINDTIGLHKMGNSDPDEVCVSLHIYSPPYKFCHVYDEKTGAEKVASLAAANQPDCPFRTSERFGLFADPMSPLSASPEIFPEESPFLSLDTFTDAVLPFVEEKKYEELQFVLDRLHLQPNEWKSFVHFDDARYTRSLLINHKSFSLFLLSWNKGQGTPIHQHNDGTRAFFKVAQGSLSLKLYDTSESDSKVKSETTFTASTPASRCCVSTDGNPFFHKICNASDSDTAVSLHLYTPAYIECQYQTHGQKKTVPVIYCDAERMVEHSEDSITHQLQTHSRVFTNLPSFVASLRHEQWSIRALTKALSSFEFHLPECQQYLSALSCTDDSRPCGRSNVSLALVAVDPLYTVFICKWSPSKSPLVWDFDGSASFVKVLSGSVREVSYGREEEREEESVENVLTEQREGVLNCGLVAYYGPNSVYSLETEGSESAIGLVLVKGGSRRVNCHCIKFGKTALFKEWKLPSLSS